jgi:hypothetical protein
MYCCMIVLVTHVLAVPIPSNPILADLLEYYAQQHNSARTFARPTTNAPPYRLLEPLTFGSLHRLEGRRNTFHLVGPCAPHNQHRRSTRLLVDIALPPERGHVRR